LRFPLERWIAIVEKSKKNRHALRDDGIVSIEREMRGRTVLSKIRREVQGPSRRAASIFMIATHTYTRGETLIIPSIADCEPRARARYRRDAATASRATRAVGYFVGRLIRDRAARRDRTSRENRDNREMTRQQSLPPSRCARIVASRRRIPAEGGTSFEIAWNLKLA